MLISTMADGGGFGGSDASSPSPANLSIVETSAGSGRTLHLSGELDLASAPAVYERIAPLIYDASEVVMDLSGVSFMDSSGLDLILRLRDRCRETHCRLALTSPSPQVLRLLEITGLIPPMQEEGFLVD